MKSSSSMSEKRGLILANEQLLARKVAADVIDKPQLALWMILIPVFFVFYFFHLKRYKNGLRDFIKHFLTTRKRVLDATCEAAEAGLEADLEAIVDVSDTPDETKDEYRLWVKALSEYFTILIQARGDTFPELVQSTYKNQTAYLLAVNKLNSTERSFNKVLTPYLPDDEGNVGTVVKMMERSVEEFRRNQAEEIFS